MSLPDKQLLRRGEVCRALGIDRRIVAKMVDAGTLTPIYVRKGSYALFNRTQLERIVGENSGRRPGGASLPK